MYQQNSSVNQIPYHVYLYLQNNNVVHGKNMWKKNNTRIKKDILKKTK